MNKTSIIYISLLLLTTLTYFLGKSETFNFTLIIIVLIITFIKAQVIIDYFMGLKNVDLKYRLFLSIWLILIIFLIGISFYIPKI